MSENTLSMREDIINCLSQQLSEYELLKAMYPNQSDIILSDNGVIQELNAFIEGQSEYTPSNLDFVVNLVVDNLKLEIFINLPISYPNEEPDVLVRCNQMNRQEESRLNTGLSEYIKSIQNGEVCLYSAITWLQDNTEMLKENDIKPGKESVDDNVISAEDKFARLWIYSHHIYNRKKREEIIKKAKEFKLTGFCLPGKPGVICIEGDNSSCNEWWKDIKSMSWKKIIIRKTETIDIEDRKFNNFIELQPRIANKLKTCQYE